MQTENPQLNEIHKQIYNAHLKASRKIQSKPWRPRKDFSKLDNEKIITLHKLGVFFGKYDYITFEEYFYASYYFHPNEYFDLKHFLTLKAVKFWNLYQTEKMKQNADSDDTIQETKQAIKFLFNFCNVHKIQTNDYLTHCIGTMPSFLQHLKKRNINFYILHALDNTSAIFCHKTDILEFFITDFCDKYNKTYNKYIKSTKLKKFLKRALKIVDKKLEITNNQ